MLDLPPAPVAEIVVTGRGLATPRGEAAYDVVTISRDRLTDVASGRLEDVLRDVAGFQQFRRADSRSAHPTAQGATLRGLGGNASSRALVVLDGVPQVDPFGGWVSFAAFDPSRLAQVRVTRGGGSGIYGPGALAGTIELGSAGLADLGPARASLVYGSRDSVDADAGVATRLGAGFATVSASYARGDGFVPIVAEDRGPVDRPARYEQGSIAARAVVPVGGETELQASTLLLFDERDRGTAFTDNRNVGADASVRLVGRGRFGWEALAYVQMRDFASSFASIDATRTTVSQSLDQYSVPATGIGGRFELRPPLGEAIELRIGGDLRGVSGSTRERYTFVAGAPTRRRDAGGRTLTAGAFVDGTLTATPELIFTAGGRIDRWRISGGHLDEVTLATGAPITALDFATRTGWEPTARGGVRWSPTYRVDVRGAGYLGWRLPTLNELYRPFRAGTDATAANPLLSPERVRGVDGGIDVRPVPGLRLSATAFWNRLDDAIANVTLGTGPGTFPGVGFVGAGGAYRQRQNLGAIRAQGVEIEAAATLNAFTLTAAFSHVDARVRADGAAASLNGLRPAQTPRDQGTLTLAWAPEDGPRASVTVRRLSRQYEDDQNQRSLAAATTFDGTLVVPLAPAVAVEMRGENLTDRTIQTAISGPGTIERAAPRTLWLGLRFGRR